MLAYLLGLIYRQDGVLVQICGVGTMAGLSRSHVCERGTSSCLGSHTFGDGIDLLPEVHHEGKAKDKDKLQEWHQSQPLRCQCPAGHWLHLLHTTGTHRQLNPPIRVPVLHLVCCGAHYGQHNFSWSRAGTHLSNPTQQDVRGGRTVENHNGALGQPTSATCC